MNHSVLKQKILTALWEKNKPDVKHSTWNERIYTEREKKYIIKGLWTFFEYLDFKEMLSN